MWKHLIHEIQILKAFWCYLFISIYEILYTLTYNFCSSETLTIRIWNPLFKFLECYESGIVMYTKRGKYITTKTLSTQKSRLMYTIIVIILPHFSDRFGSFLLEA